MDPIIMPFSKNLWTMGYTINRGTAATTIMAYLSEAAPHFRAFCEGYCFL